MSTNLYKTNDIRFITEINRERLCIFVDALKKPGYIQVPQQQSYWSIAKQSKLIESFLVNIPVPQIVLYEREYNCYEVIDGQQRICAIRAFYDNKLILRNLEILTELNGHNYSSFSSVMQAKIDRQVIQLVTIVKDSQRTHAETLFLKTQVLKRLN